MPQKSLVKRLEVDEAKASHKCHHSKKHPIAKGDTRLKVIEGRSKTHYCVECARKSLEAGIDRLKEVLGQLKRSR